MVFCPIRFCLNEDMISNKPKVLRLTWSQRGCHFLSRQRRMLSTRWRPTYVLDMPLSSKNLLSRVQYMGAFLVAQACANSMVRKIQSQEQSTASGQPRTTAGNSIIFTASVWTHLISAGQTLSTYAASKAAIRGLVRPLAMELAQYGIRVNSLSPGPIMTGVLLEWKRSKPEAIKQLESETMFGRLGSEEDLKGVILFLASSASSWVTGQDLCVDGGNTAWKHPGV
jgi:sorbose reductase